METESDDRQCESVNERADDVGRWRTETESDDRQEAGQPGTVDAVDVDVHGQHEKRQ
jgi:hypothetical protein